MFPDKGSYELKWYRVPVANTCRTWGKKPYVGCSTGECSGLL